MSNNEIIRIVSFSGLVVTLIVIGILMASASLRQADHERAMAHTEHEHLMRMRELTFESCLERAPFDTMAQCVEVSRTIIRLPSQ